MGLTLVVCTLALFATATAQMGGAECEMSDLFTGGTLEREMAELLLANNNSTPPAVTVLRNHTVCLSAGPTRGSISSISLVIEYNCTGSATCSPGGSAVEQYDFGCNNQSQWSFVQFGDVEHGRTIDPTANFVTSPRTDCGACFPVHPNPEDPPTIDPVTHCHGRPHTVLLASESHDICLLWLLVIQSAEDAVILGSRHAMEQIQVNAAVCM